MINIRQNIYYQRRQLQPKLPKNSFEVMQVLDTLHLETIKNEPFLAINNVEDQIIIFSCTSNLQHLCESEKIYLDGTFTYCTKFFLQLFTLHIIKNGHYIPLAFCLLPNKLEKTYKKLFELLRNKCEQCKFTLAPKHAVVDFEIAIHNAIKSVWPNVKLVGCRFHLRQAWFRKIQNLGLTSTYKDKTSIKGKWIRYIFGLPFLSSQEVGDCFAFELSSIQPQEEPFVKLADYFVDNYIGEDAAFPPSMWAEASASTELTTNACESFHSRFNSRFYNVHPSLYLFIDVLKDMQTDTYIKLKSVQELKKIKNRNVQRRHDILAQKIEQYEQKQIIRFEFLKFVSHLNLL